MVENKQVSIARHGYFYKIFFTKYGELLESMLDISYGSIIVGYKNLEVFYSSYSYWIKEDDKDNYIIDKLINKKKKLQDNKEYNKLVVKYESKGLASLTYTELQQFNKTFYDEFLNLMYCLELFNLRLAPNDMLPNLTNMHEEYDRQLAFVIYDTFYEKLYNIHSKIIDKLMSFDIVGVIECFKYLLVFFYGYNYYMPREEIQNVKKEFEDLFSIYNNKEFLSPFFRFINMKATDKDYKILYDYRERFFNKLNEIFENINSQLPKSNIFPKKQDKIMIDDTLI